MAMVNLRQAAVAAMAVAAGCASALAESIRNGDFEFSAGKGIVTFRDAKRGEDLIRMADGKFMLPSFAGEAKLGAVKREGDSMTLEYTGAKIKSGKVEVKKAAHGFLVRSRFTPFEDVQVNRLNLVSADAHTAMWSVDNFRNRHRTHAVTPELNLGQQFETSTFSDDWQFAPHPSVLVFNRAGRRLTVGATEAPVGGYGLRLKAKGYKLNEFYLDYGAEPWGWKVKAGEEWIGAEFLWAYNSEPAEDVFAAFAQFGGALVRLGKISDPKTRKYFGWHREHVYCTWLDQCNAANFVPEVELKDQAVAGTKAKKKIAPQTMITEQTIRDAAAKILREKLPIRTIILDDGWAVNEITGQAHPERFPNMRKLVDDLHAMGFKVCAWWVWSEIRREEVKNLFKQEWLTAGGKQNHFKMWVPDYSKAATREQFLKPLIRRLFSDEAGCYNFDGVKTDFMADKVHPDMPAEDPQWRGEENYFVKLYSFFFNEMRRHKPDAMHIGCSGNYFLAEYIDVNRTFDVASDDWMEHENRAKMCIATTPGTSPVYDMHMYRYNLADFLESARRMDVPVHVSSINLILPEFNAAPVPASAEDMAIWREGLKR